MNLLDIPLTTLEGEPATLSEYAGKALLVVNVASRCGFTYQYEALQALHQAYEERGFAVLGFPCNQFLEQEPGTAEDIRSFCDRRFGVTFPLFAKCDVVGDERHPLFAELSAAPDADGEAGDVRWNFEKVLISPGGAIVKRFRTQVEPNDPDLVQALEAALPQ